jgi:hypothetical protein
VTAEEGLEIGPARERGRNPNDYLSWPGDRCFDLAIIDLPGFE